MPGGATDLDRGGVGCETSDIVSEWSLARAPLWWPLVSSEGKVSEAVAARPWFRHPPRRGLWSSLVLLLAGVLAISSSPGVESLWLVAFTTFGLVLSVPVWTIRWLLWRGGRSRESSAAREGRRWLAGLVAVLAIGGLAFTRLPKMARFQLVGRDAFARVVQSAPAEGCWQFDDRIGGYRVLGVNRVDGNVFFITNAVLFDESGFAYAPNDGKDYDNAGMVSLGGDWYAFSGIAPQDERLGFGLHPDCLPN